MAECQRYDREFVIICVSRCSILLAARFTHNHDDATFWRYNYDYARILTKCVGFANTPRAVFQILCFCYGRRVCAYVAHTREVPTCITGVVITNTWSSNMFVRVLALAGCATHTKSPRAQTQYLRFITTSASRDIWL